MPNTIADALAQGVIPQPVTLVDTTGNAYNASGGSGGSVQLLDAGGTNKAAIDAAGNQATKGGYTEITGLSASAINAYLVPSTDVSAYKSWSLHIGSSTYSGTLTFYGSNNGSTWVPVIACSQTTYGGQTTTTNANNSIFVGSIGYRYLAIQMTSYASGTCNAVLELYTYALAPFSVYANVTSFPGTTDNNVALSSTAYTANANSSDLTNYVNTGVYVYVNCGTFGAGATGVTMTIQGKDYATAIYYNILQSAALSPNTFNVFCVHPGIPTSPNNTSMPLPRTWRTQLTASAWGTGGSTVGVTYGYLL